MQAYVPDCLRAEELVRLRACDVRRNFMSGFRMLVETTDWKAEVQNLERLAGPLCWGVIGASILYFLPVLFTVLSG
jgi:hypothetical protein